MLLGRKLKKHGQLQANKTLTLSSKNAGECNNRYKNGAEPLESNGEPPAEHVEKINRRRVQVLVGVEFVGERLLRPVGTYRLQTEDRRTYMRKHGTFGWRQRK